MLLRTSIFACLALLASAPLAAQTPGSAFIVNRFGQHSDGNAFVRKDGAYLAGGPGLSCTGAGLADGLYCFAITDPAGTVLLTNDPIGERTVRVGGGVIIEYLGTTRIRGRGPCDSKMVRLVPFDTTPFPSHEYKLWLTRIEDLKAPGEHVFGFDPAKSKSDNFRVTTTSTQSIVRGSTYFDDDMNGVWNPILLPTEVPIGGWRVEIFRNGILDGVTFADMDGTYLFIRDRDSSTYSVREFAPGGFVNDSVPGAVWLATTPREGAVITSQELVPAPEFGNVGFELQAQAGRSVSFWGSYDDDCSDPADPNKPSGRELLAACDPIWRDVLTTRNGAPIKLRKPISSDAPSNSIFTPPPSSTFDIAFETWDRYTERAPNDHAGFLLSREVAGAILNNRCGYMQGVIYVDRFQDGVLVSLDAMLDGAIGLLTETGAGLTGPNDPFQDLRTRMLNCTNEFLSINETGDLTAAQVVYRRSHVPLLFDAPYFH